MDLQKFNFLLLSTHGRVLTMAPLSLDRVQKVDLAKTGLFFHNNTIKCIGCSVTMDKINARRAKRHTYSDNCTSAINALLVNESLRKHSFVSFKWARRQFKSQTRVIDMLSRRGFYCSGKRARVRCAGCQAVTAYVSVDNAQKAHVPSCTFRHVIDVSLDDCAPSKILQVDLPPPRREPQDFIKPSAPPDASAVAECKVCFSNEKSVCFLPCRHLVVCAECSLRCKRCCVCNSKIVDRINTLPQ
ncbi:IAP2 [Hyphantria cunea nucleopolyhedrovirus]|uniref:HcIAP-2 n=1 Tax=Hyphantria cunea nuclear polyhedrosis virus TaxID=28288 RepID=Q80SF5_NPVHC|nr:IAP2 [Hyphantria cunea nucleopolyhedrovirus]BAC55951.1 HcIAP-2 [Hyphantria cunea nucleopolyhedrovirus]BAE72369.1 IAP2 [Hyphantria cunea nucleopolyhedrovirus]